MFSIWKKDLINIDKNICLRGTEKYFVIGEKYFRFEPIIWRVLKYSNKEMLLISDKCLDCQEYHNESKYVYWEETFIRKWLNSEFYTIAFSKAEKTLFEKIDNDFVTMPLLENLSDESLTFDRTLDVTPTRESLPTDYAMERGAYSGPTGTCYWWYKIPFGNASISPFVYDNGGLLNYSGAFRVMIKISLKRYEENIFLFKTKQ